MNKIKTFELELDMIEDNDLKNLVKRCLENAPDYFYGFAGIVRKYDY